MQNTQNFTVSLDIREAEKLRGSLFKPETAMVVEKIQKQILSILEQGKAEDEDFYVARYGQPDLFANSEK